MLPPTGRRLSARARRQSVALLLVISLLALTAPLPRQFASLVPTASADTGAGSVSLTAAGVAVTENFNTLSNTAGSTTNSTLPAGWYITETGGGARDNEQYAVDTGGSTTGDTYSYGTAGSTDRALGALRSGTLVPLFGARFTNNTGVAIDSLTISYTGEQWRLGTAGRADRIDFQISTNAADLSTGTWTDVNDLDFTTPNTATTGAKDGNAAGNRVSITGTVSSLNIPAGASFFVRWTDFDASGADDGLTVDDFSLSANGLTPPPTPSPTTTPTPTPTPIPTPTPTPTPTPVAPGAVVISQVYGGGGNAGAIYKNDYIEIFNRSPETITLNNWSVQFAQATASSWTSTTFSATLAPGQYFLIRQAAGTSCSGSACGQDLPTFDATGNLGVGSVSGKVALVNNSNTLTGNCPTGVVDFLGYGTVNCSEGDDATPGDNSGPAVSNTQAVFRAADGCSDTNSNAADFSAGAPLPRSSGSPTKNCDDVPPPTSESDSTVVISQLYAGGGNSGAVYTHDFVELYNRGTAPVNIGGWSLQYASATGSGWDFTKQPLGGVIAPGEYYLVGLASGGAAGSPLPPTNIAGEINMSATAGKMALVRNADGLEGACPLSDPDLEDFVGYGSTASCGEGNKRAATPGAANSLFRKNGGAADTDNNQSDFLTGVPGPRRTSPIVELGPFVFGTDPRQNSTTAPRDASITVNFTEAVEVTGQWFDIQCSVTGAHNSATVSGGLKSFTITPDASFVNGEVCTVRVFKTAVSDLDADDSGPDTDNLPADYVWTFTTSTGAPPPYGPDIHLAMGNPSGAAADTSEPNNYLMEKPEFALSYNRDKGTANWVSWHLSNEWVGALPRLDTFRPDPAVPSDWYRVLSTDYTNSGFDRGHMVPNADRDHENSMPINQATFLMTNIVPQSPDNNQGPWASQENYFRTLLPANELYIVAGGAGQGGAGSNGPATTIAGGKVSVPSHTWKVALVLPKGDDDLSRVTCGARTIAVLMPNVQGIRNDNWENYLVSVDQIEALTGYDFFSNLPDAVEHCVESGVNGNNNAPGAENLSVGTDEDSAATFTLSALSANNNPLVYTVLSQPAHGTLTGEGAERTYTPAPDFHGTDSFTFRASSGALNSNTATVTVTVHPVNDAPTLSNVPDAAAISELSSYTFTAAAGDVDVPAQPLVFSLSNAPAGAAIDPATGQFAWTPTEAQGGTGAPYTFEVRVSDGAAEAVRFVTLTVGEVNQAPTLAPVGNKVVPLGGTLGFTAAGADADAPAQSLTYSLTGAVPAGASIDAATGVFNWTPSPAQVGAVYTFGVRVTDDGPGALSAQEQISVGVAYNWSGVLQPINPDGSSVFKLGRTVPVKFSLTGLSAGITNATARLTLVRLNGDVAGTEAEAESTSAATSGNLFRYDPAAQQYVFNLDTKGLTAGTYQLRVDMSDGSVRVFNISLRD